MKDLNIHNIWRTCNKIRSAASRVNINFWDYFKPLDSQQATFISESHFLSVLSGPLGNLIGLSNQEICELADYFRSQDGRILYTQFCEIIHENNPIWEKNPAWVSGQEWEDPLQMNCLSVSEQRRVEIIITKIACFVNKKKLILNPYFQDYELISKNCGVVTFAHFARVLHFLGITLSSEELYLLIKKFAKDSYTVNYVAFLQTIKEVDDFLQKHEALDKGGNLLKDFKGRIESLEFPKLPRPEITKIKAACVFPRQLHFLPVDISSKRLRAIQELLLRLQEHVYKLQIPVAQYFQDFDTFNVGRITKNQFRRALDALQSSPRGKFYLAEEEIDDLIAFYTDPNDNERVCWRIFEDDLEQVFSVRHLEKHPDCKIKSPPKEVKALPRKGYQEWECCAYYSKEEMDRIYHKTFRKIVYRLKERRFSLKRYFQDFDKINRGHVTRAQLRQVFSVAAIPLTLKEILSLEYMHYNDTGFHYREFINKIEDLMDNSSLKSPEIISKLPKKFSPSEKVIDLILAKIKAKVVCDGVKVNQFFRKFDKRNARIVKRSEFHRGLDQLKCDLTCSEVNTIMHHFASPQNPEYIDYWKFSEVVEAAKAKEHLEKTPLVTPAQYIPCEATPRSFLNFDERQILMRTLNELVKYVSWNLEDVFKDFDKKVNTGTVTKNQLIRTLTVRNIISAINANELEVLFKCFSVGHIKTEAMFDYRSFLNALRILKENSTAAIPF